jgi:hypothetical protein
MPKIEPCRESGRPPVDYIRYVTCQVQILILLTLFHRSNVSKVIKGKGNVHPETGQEGSEGE